MRQNRWYDAHASEVDNQRSDAFLNQLFKSRIKLRVIAHRFDLRGPVVPGPFNWSELDRDANGVDHLSTRANGAIPSTGRHAPRLRGLGSFREMPIALAQCSPLPAALVR